MALILFKENLNYLIMEVITLVTLSHNFHYSITNWLPFYWQGFNQTSYYTYLLEELSDLEKIWTEFTQDNKCANIYQIINNFMVYNH